VWGVLATSTVTVTPEFVELRREFAGVVRTKRVDTAAITAVVALENRDEDGDPTGDYRVEIRTSRTTLGFAADVERGEAEYLAALVLSKIRPEARSDTDWGWHRVDPPPPVAEPTPKPSLLTRARPVAFPVIVMCALVWLALQTLSQPSHRQAMRTTTSGERTFATEGPPYPEQFANARSYATATTLYNLRTSAEILGDVDCGDNPTWDSWECAVLARDTIGPYAGRAMTFSCTSLISASSTTRAIRCGPKNPPRLGSGRVMPRRSDFPNARAYAAAVTIYALESAKTTVYGAPDCGAHVTWAKWRCTVQGQSRIGPYAGRSLTYSCAPDSDRSVTCGPVNPPPL
jgi:hypothetical protein